MKISKSTKGLIVIVGVFIIQMLVHYWVAENVWEMPVKSFANIYLYLGLIIAFTITIIELANMAFKEQLGFVFLGIIFFKLATAFLLIQKTDVGEMPSKIHFIIAYLVVLFLLVFYVAQKLLDTDKKH